MNRIVFIVSFMVMMHLQAAQVYRDTSYTTRSAYTKIVKHYQYAKMPELAGAYHVREDVKMMYHTWENRIMYADLFRPLSGSTDAPGVLLVHGGGWSSGDKSMHTPLARLLAQEGFVVMVPEYRLSSEAIFPAAVADIRMAISWLRSHAQTYGVDAQKISLVGFSAGGQLAALVGTTAHLDNFLDDGAPAPGAVQAIIDIDGVLKFRHPVSEEGTMAARWLGSTYEQLPNSWEVASPLNHVSERTPPTLFIASSFPRFLAGHEEYMTLLQSYGIRTGKIQMDDAPHSFWLFEPWFSQTRLHITSFLTEIFELTR